MVCSTLQETQLWERTFDIVAYMDCLRKNNNSREGISAYVILANLACNTDNIDVYTIMILTSSFESLKKDRRIVCSEQVICNFGVLVTEYFQIMTLNYQ